MYLAKVLIQNYRIFQKMDLDLNKGLNILLGENDSGKTALVDSIRLVLGTRDYDRMILTKDDFFVNNTGRTCNLKIQLVFEDLSDEEARLFLEWIGIRERKPNGSLAYFLKVTFEASRKNIDQLANKFDREINYSLTAGPDEVGSSLVPEVRDLLRATYLKPLRDAEQELAARKGSRLSQILIAHPDIRQQDNSTDANSIPGIINTANRMVREHPSIQRQSNSLNQNYLSNFSLGDNPIAASINISDPSLKSILERLELSLLDAIPDVQTNHGLGLNNLLFMATEMLLLGSNQSSELPLLLIEEPEAHLHPQLQIRLMEFLLQQTIPKDESRPIQIIVTSHSPNLASTVALESVVLVVSGKTFPLGPQYTCLNHNDYLFLQRFLDVTKANLFFAKGVIIVEGPSEQILIPQIARFIGLPFEKFGISMVNVETVGLFRYARIFQRKNGDDIGIRVACITDLDIPPDEAKELVGNRRTKRDFSDEQITQLRQQKVNRAVGGPVQVYVSPQWTLEFALCSHHLGIALLFYQAVKMAELSKNRLEGITNDEMLQIKREVVSQYHAWRIQKLTSLQISTNIYDSFINHRASKPEASQFFVKILEEKIINVKPDKIAHLFPEYIILAIKYVTRGR